MPWYALYTKPRNEKKAAEELQLKGYEVYLPLISTIRQWSDRKKKVQIPLFNSYLFIHTEFEKNYTDVLSVNGVLKFVRIGKEIATIRDEQIQYIKTFLTHEAQLEVVSNTAFSLGDSITIAEGPFKGITGRLAEYRKANYFAVEIEQLGANLMVTLPAAYISKNQ
ncbi:MAG: UpxY family transcription antiterminator [Bacteroidota bacterium]|jgi:transcription elongation factor/antiterminator RfaH